MCNEVVEKDPYTPKFSPDRYKTQKISVKDVREDPYTLQYIPMDLNIQEMCNTVMEEDLYNLIYVPDWFFAPKMLVDLDNIDDLNSDDCNKVVDWYYDYRKRKLFKKQIDKELLPIV